MRASRLLLVSLIVCIIAIAPLGSALAQSVQTSAHFRLPANVGWVNSGFALTRGQPVTVFAEGMAVTARINLWGPRLAERAGWTGGDLPEF